MVCNIFRISFNSVVCLFLKFCFHNYNFFSDYSTIEDYTLLLVKIGTRYLPSCNFLIVSLSLVKHWCVILYLVLKVLFRINIKPSPKRIHLAHEFFTWHNWFHNQCRQQEKIKGISFSCVYSSHCFYNI